MIVLDKLLDRVKGNHQVLIFSQFTSVLDVLEDYLAYKNFTYCRIDGSTFIEDRESQIEDFTRPNSDKFVFLLSTRAGGLGINLMTADTVVLFDSDWNPQMDLQAMDRAHRIGQKNPVNVYRLISENTIEEKIIERQAVKIRWSQVIIRNSKTVLEDKVKKEDLENMLLFGS